MVQISTNISNEIFKFDIVFILNVVFFDQNEWEKLSNTLYDT